ncbi:MAG: BolA family transcriptional regulator [Proteobacteria bacterium]|nr:BolA family transcriptional regulator [Pseudomonadota bacterium]
MIESNIPDCVATVTGDGRHFDALVIAPLFEGMGLLARQRQVYSALGNNIHNGNIHALSIKAKTPSEIANEK